MSDVLGEPKVGRWMIVLVVEDEALINWMAAEELQQAGHVVISAYTADEAIEILESRDDIWLIFSDIDMPGSMDGLRLAAAVRDRWPPIHIILTSGKNRPEEHSMPRGSLFLDKPYPLGGLASAVETFV